jgi:hypothetical protein
MKRWFFAVAIAAVASVMVAATASADVPRYQTQTSTFTVTQPYGQVGQWNDVWTHNYTVTSQCDGTFAGTGVQLDNQGHQADTETITGTFGPNHSVTFTAMRNDGVSWTLTNAPTDGNAVTLATTNPAVGWPVEMKVSTPVTTTSDFKNHGDYVKSQGGGDDTAHSCIGMPISSNQ